MFRVVTLTVACLGMLLWQSPSIAQVREVVRASVSSASIEANAASSCPTISADGSILVFSSSATNLVDGSLAGSGDLFVRNIVGGTTSIGNTISSSSFTTFPLRFGGCDYDLAADGRYLVFAAESAPTGSPVSFTSASIVRKDLSTGDVTVASVAFGGGFANGGSRSPSISADGRYIAFTSEASNLVSSDTNGVADVFRYDTQAGTTVRVSVSNAGAEANSFSSGAAVSDDGRYVLFSSYATNLTSDDANSNEDLFLRDIDGGTTIRVTQTVDSQPMNSSTFNPSLSGDGRHVVFASSATNLVSNDTNGTTDVFLYDLDTAMMERINVSSSEEQANEITYLEATRNAVSRDGRFVAFGSLATNLVANDINGNFDIFVRDRDTGNTLLGSVRPTCLDSGEQGNETSEGAAMSADGTHLAFLSIADNFVSGDANSLRDAFRSEFIPPASFRRGVGLTDEANVGTCSGSAAIVMPLFLPNTSSALRRQIQALKIRYDVRVSRSGARKELARKINKRNSIALRNLATGSYTVRYRLLSGAQGTTKPLTRFSAAQTFVVE